MPEVTLRQTTFGLGSSMKYVGTCKVEGDLKLPPRECLSVVSIAMIYSPIPTAAARTQNRSHAHS